MILSQLYGSGLGFLSCALCLLVAIWPVHVPAQSQKAGNNGSGALEQFGKVSHKNSLIQAPKTITPKTKFPGFTRPL
eukprot:2019700-Amphidinium_carterae.1